PEQRNEKPEEVPPAVTETRDEPAPAPVPPRTRKTSASLMRAIVLHLEGRIEEAIQEIKIGLQQGEPPAELYSAMGALQVELEHYDDAAATYREVLKIDPQNQAAAEHLALCVEKSIEAKKPPKPSPSLLKAIAFHIDGK